MRLIKFFSTAASIAVLLAGCGGGGGGGGSGNGSGSNETASTSPASPYSPASSTSDKLSLLTGTAATGAPFAAAKVTVIDQTGAIVGTATTNADGTYQVPLATAATPPFVIQAIRDDRTLISVVPDARSSTINITPITTLIASRLSVSGDPTKLAAELQANPSLISTTTVTAKVSEVVQILQPLLSAVGSTANPLTGTFTTDGTGMDRALDSLLISITPATSSSTNIEVAIKQQNTEGSQPLVLQFTNQTSSLPALSNISSTTLVPAGTATLIDDLLKRLVACYALPVTERVANPEALSAPPSDITASACKTLFVNNDPGVYLTNGDRIGGADRAKPFNGIFRSGATGVQFDRGAYQFTRVNGDMVISFRTVDSLGGIQDQSAVVRKSAADSKLYLIGDQYAYAGSVTAYHQLRTFINQPAADHYDTGYVFNVANNGQFSRVVVTSPKGKTIPLVSNAGNSYLVIPINGAPSSTNFLRVRSEFADAANSANPATYETNLPNDPDRPSNEEIASFAANSVWRFDYYLASNSSSTPDATQYYRTQARALTIPEMKYRGLATLNDDMLNGIKTASAGTNVVPLGNTDSVIPFSWTVPNGAVMPTFVRLFGQGPATSTPRIRFDDGITVNSTARVANVSCQQQSSGDNHCAQVNGATVFANGSFANGFDLRGTDDPGRTFSHFYATYKILP